LKKKKKDDVPPTTILTTSTIESSPPPVLPTTTDHTTILSNVHIDLQRPDDRLDATIEKLLSTEEPHYQLPSSEPVPLTPIENEYSLPEPNTYDIPRSFKTPSVENIQIHTEEKIFNNEIITPSPTIDISTEQKVQSDITTKIEPMPKVEVNETSTKGSYTLPTKKIEN